jgi:Zn ribbon nucleic-acid-binding protein
MTHLTIETVECPGCGHSHTIEVDTEKAMKEAKEKFFKKHGRKMKY